MASDLKLDYFTDDWSRLSLLDALHLIKRNFRPGDGIPQKLLSNPWRLEDRKSLNPILEHSMKVQMGTLPNTEFNEYILSDQVSLVVNGLILGYLSSG